MATFNAYGYARHSHPSQAKKFNNGGVEADTLDSQDRSCRKYFAANIQSCFDISYEKTFFDRAVSAHSVPFDKRPAAIELLRTVRAGDHIIIDKLDRVYRKLKDFVRQGEWFERHGVVVHYVDNAVRTDTAAGRLFLQQRASFAEFEAANTSERIRATNASMRERGIWCRLKLIPHFCNIHMIDGRPIMVWDAHYRALAKKIVELHDEQGLPYRVIAKQLAPLATKFRLTTKTGFEKQPLRLSQVEWYYKMEKTIIKHGVTEPGQIYDAWRAEQEERKMARMIASRNKPKKIYKPRDKKKYLRKLGIVT
jgi:DNA invertase Pin-like site-specific DNA recombinase